MGSLLTRLDTARARIVALFPDRELYVRSNGRVRFLKISSGFQQRVAGAIVGFGVVWLGASALMLVEQADVASREALIDMQARAVAATESRVAAYRESIDTTAERLEARQALLDGLATQYFGDTSAKATPASTPNVGSVPAAAEGKAVTSHLVPDANRLEAIETAQLAYAERVAHLATIRADRTAKTVRKLGLDPDRLAKSRAAVGGPFVPLGQSQGSINAPEFIAMVDALTRLDRIERALLAVPSFKPAANGTLTSSFGFRLDPFTRWPAMHQGQDFSGRHGEPIRAAAPGKVVRAGWWAGYGRAVEIDHGRGIRTRYAHMSKLDVKPGMRIERGMIVGRMGSSGRSTGTHLHFEVRVDGRAVNPRPFLEASADVLKIQGSIRERLDSRAQRTVDAG